MRSSILLLYFSVSQQIEIWPIHQMVEIAISEFKMKVESPIADMLIIPYFENAHYSAVVVDFTTKTVSHYDSKYAGDFMKCQRVMDALQLNQEWRILLNEVCPQQGNDDDCGVFVCMLAERMSRNAPLSYRQHGIPSIRKRMQYEILKQQLMVRNI